MAIPENIEELAHKVRTEIYGRDVREALASSMEATAEVADWSRQVAQAIIDGEFDEAALATEIEQKLTQLEQDYAPTLTSLEQEKVSKSGDTMDGILYLQSEPTDNPNSSNHKTSRIILESYLKSNKPNDHAGDVLQLMWKNHGAKPFIGWWDAATDPDTPELKAWVGAHDLANNPDADPHNHWSIEVSDSNGALQTRMAFPFDQDHTNIKTSSADFTVGYGILRIGGRGGNRDLEFSDSTEIEDNERRFTIRLDNDNNLRFIPRDDNGEPVGSVMFMDRLNSRIGMGTSNPTHQLHIRSANQAVRVEGMSQETMTPLFVLDHADSSRRVFGVQVTNDTDYRFVIEASGAMSWGEGNGRDTHLYRARFGRLATDADLLFTGQKGVMLEDSNGGLWRIKVNTDGTLATINMS
ncbi:hypothetical protein ACTNEO_19900 [Gracilibacillus sp. HCP3S3_G5_1]|uniref:hypothetical protein n=1 Tax=unclassified Gracilibacillus TaxID=2625209 RepID=UPI003F8876DD